MTATSHTSTSLTYYNTQTQTFGHSHDDVARATNANFAPGTLQVGDYRLYEMAPEPAYNPPTRSALN